jgi:hypothetical protein
LTLACVAILCAALAVPATAQPLACTNSLADPPLVRAENITALTNDVVFDCTGGTPTAAGQPVPVANITVTLNTSLTSRILANRFTEVLLLIDEPNSAINPFPLLNCGQNGAPDNSVAGPGICQIVSTGNPYYSYDGTANGYGSGGALCDGSGGRPAANSYGCGRPNVFQGVLTQASQVTFFNVPLDPPGNGNTRILRVTNLRVDATPFGFSNASFYNNEIDATISVSPSSALTLNNPNTPIAVIYTGLNTSTSSSSSTQNITTFSEGFAIAFSPKNLSLYQADGGYTGGMWEYAGGTNYPADEAQNVPGSLYYSESGFEFNSSTAVPNLNPPTPDGPPSLLYGTPGGAVLNDASTGIAGAGVATQGTRLALSFSNVPAGASVIVPTEVYLARVNTSCSQVQCATGVMILTNTDSAGAGPFSAVTGSTIAGVNNVAVAGNNLAVYEVLFANPGVLEGANVPWMLTDGTNLLPVSGVTASGSFAPYYGATVADAPAPTAIPRFGPVPPMGVYPTATSGATQTFTLSFTDPAGYADLSVVDILINNYLDGVSACYLAFAPAGPPTGYLYLVDDAGNGGYVNGSPIEYPEWFSPGMSNLQNSHCTITGANSFVWTSSNTLSLTLELTFSESFAGNRVFYLAARTNGGANTGWQAMGTWNVPGGPAPMGPAVGGVAPGRSATAAQTYTFTFTDTNGFADLAVVDVLTNNFLDGIGACYVAFAPTSATSGYLYLVDDAGDGGYASGSPIALPSSGTLSNSQCTISAAGSSVSASGNTLTLNLATTFNSSFAGNRVFYLAARNGTGGNSGWQAVGSVTVP